MTDPRSAYDAQLARCPVMHDTSGGTGAGDTWTLLGHREVREAANDPVRFSSAVSRFLQLPNGLDGDAHARFRAVVESFMSGERVTQIEPRCAGIAARIVAELTRTRAVDAVWDLGAPFAVSAQVGWLGWAPSLQPALLDWMVDHGAAIRSRVDAHLADISERFDGMVRAEVAARREAADEFAHDDVTSELMTAVVDGVPLVDEQIVSILRNWTAGDLGSLAASIGVIVHFLATHADIQDELRACSARVAHEPEARTKIDRSIDEMLRIDDPFLSNRRVTTCDVEVAGQLIPKGSRVVLAWTAANRDPAVFADPDAYDPEGNVANNLVYGTGPHVCPGRALATMELRVLTCALLDATSRIRLAPNDPPVRSESAVGGYRTVPVIIE